MALDRETLRLRAKAIALLRAKANIDAQVAALDAELKAEAEALIAQDQPEQ